MEWGNIRKFVSRGMRFFIMEYRSDIVDECGVFVAWCYELSEDERDLILNNHPEYSIRCLECEPDGYCVSMWDL